MDSEKLELAAHLTAFIGGVLKIVILLVALLALQEGRKDRVDAAQERAQTLKILTLCSAAINEQGQTPGADRSDDAPGVSDFSEVKK